MRRHAGAGGIKLQFADRDPCAVGAEIAETQDPPAVRDADEPNVLLGPVSQDLFHLAAARHREIHAAGLAVNVAEFQTGLADRRIINDGQKVRRVGHDRPIEQRLIVVEQLYQINIAVEVGRLVAELHPHPVQLHVHALGHVRH